MTTKEEVSFEHVDRALPDGALAPVLRLRCEPEDPDAVSPIPIHLFDERVTSALIVATDLPTLSIEDAPEDTEAKFHVYVHGSNGVRHTLLMYLLANELRRVGEGAAHEDGTPCLKTMIAFSSFILKGALDRTIASLKDEGALPIDPKLH